MKRTDPRPPERPEGVTDRQMEVARLVAGGKTNPEIADALGISLDGAKYHVSELLGRLGLKRREEIGEWYRHQDGTRRRLRSAFGLPVGALVGGGAAVVVVALVAAVVVALFTQTESDIAWRLDYAQGTWESVAIPDHLPRTPEPATLPDGRVVLVGGVGDDALPAADVWVFDPASEEFEQLGELAEPRFGPAVRVLPDGRVAVLGGTPRLDEGATRFDRDAALRRVQVIDVDVGEIEVHEGAALAHFLGAVAVLETGAIVGAQLVGEREGAPVGEPEGAHVALWHIELDSAPPGPRRVAEIPIGETELVLPQVFALDVFAPDAGAVAVFLRETVALVDATDWSFEVMEVDPPLETGVTPSAAVLEGGRVITAGGWEWSSYEAHQRDVQDWIEQRSDGSPSVPADTADLPSPPFTPLVDRAASVDLQTGASAALAPLPEPAMVTRVTLLDAKLALVVAWMEPGGHRILTYDADADAWTPLELPCPRCLVVTTALLSDGSVLAFGYVQREAAPELGPGEQPDVRDYVPRAWRLVPALTP